MSASDRPRRESSDSDSSGADDAATSPKAWTAWGGGPGWQLPLGGRGDEQGRTTGGSDSWWADAPFGLLVAVGALLVVFPEPATSLVGLVLVAFGVIGWLASR